MKRPYATKDANRQRSASAPVGIVAAVSMKTAEKRNIARFAGSCATLMSPNFEPPDAGRRSDAPT